MPAILFVLTSASKTLGGRDTGWYLSEAAHPYYILAPHFTIDFASPAGPNPPPDPDSIKDLVNDADSVKFLNDETVKSKLATTKKLSEVNEKDYLAIFYAGGLGPVLDLASDPTNAKLASQFYQAKKITAAVCHGPAALVKAVDASGKSIFSGKNLTGFSNTEEEIGGKGKEIPFLLEDAIIALGGKYEKAPEPWGVKVVVDGHLITGQNPASAGGVGRAILEALM
ncbi:ThiJ/PfpI [Collybia nuda]|uniref:D-lactate dehydratase n=1 Tax=Collybia nuda TaxID=64659 RepID=A0A9P6CE53_9AGAR|nr:ThiJ/PfpI [Collybia nuda]